MRTLHSSRTTEDTPYLIVSVLTWIIFLYLYFQLLYVYDTVSQMYIRRVLQFLDDNLNSYVIFTVIGFQINSCVLLMTLRCFAMLLLFWFASRMLKCARFDFVTPRFHLRQVH